jgi:3',5'-cyclic-AMP phosphodiesterase
MAIFLVLMVVLSCENPFSYSPFETIVKEEYRNSTQKNLKLIDSLDNQESVPFKIALIADTHYHYDDLYDALSVINTKTDILFILIGGDIAESGLRNDYVYFQKVMRHSTKPYLTVIGNHDYLSNGSTIYRDMFGELNYTFTFNNVKFVLFDNVFWESKKLPDFSWLERELSDQQGYDHVIPFMHIPPFDQQFENHREQYHQLLVDHDIRFSIHGHRHTYDLRDIYGDGIQILSIGSPSKRSYCELTVTPQQISVEQIHF